MSGRLSELHRRFLNYERYRWLANVRWPLMSVIVGIVAGVGTICFEELLVTIKYYALQIPTGYAEPVQGAKPAAVAALASIHSWLFLVIPVLGALVSGLIVYFIAPEAKGEGTDAMIESFHERGGFIRKRVPFVKIIASALVIGSGGSAGREGPISQIGSGFGSIMATILGLKPKDRRILVLAGAAGGLGAIFHAPLGAALFAPEVLYSETEFEFEAILPCIVSSIVASSIFDQYFGRAALFFPGPVNFDPVELLPYAIFGIVCALAGFIWVKTFHGGREWFFDKLDRIKLLSIVKPALGGLLVGGIALKFPQVLSGGYGWIQASMDGNIIWQTMFLLVLVKIVGTTCTIQSGGSGGIFGPSVFMGAMLGGGFGLLGHQLFPHWVINPHAFVLVGIGGFFAGVAKVPIAAIIMACEMCGSYTLLVPLMLVSTISFLLLGGVNLYDKQVSARLASPAHLTEFSRGLLEGMQVSDAIKLRQVTAIPEDMPFDQLIKVISNSPEVYFPVFDQEGRMTGILSINDVRAVMFETSLHHLVVAKDVAIPNVVRVGLQESLQEALDKMVLLNVDELPVVREDSPDKIVGMISKRDIISYYHSRATS
jgi:chloride channel protein, CIC family